MRQLKIKFEAACPCLWLWSTDEDGSHYWGSTDVFDGCSEASRELWDDDDICRACAPLEDEYDETCFVNGSFEPHGWKSEVQMKAFNQKMIDLWEFLREHLKGKYEVSIGGFFDNVDSVYANSKEPVL